MSEHPICSLFPPMSSGEYANLKGDIAAHGVREAVWTFGGRLIDGRHRSQACGELGAECPTREYEGDEPGLTAFVVGLNLHRRHLNESQRAMVAAKLTTAKPGRPAKTGSIDPVTDSRAAEMLNTSEKTVERAKKVRRDGVPELAAAVEAGDLSVDAASRVADLAPTVQQELVAKGEKEIVAAAKRIKAEKIEKQKAEREKKRLADLQERAAAAPPVDPAAAPWQVVEGDCVTELPALVARPRLIFADPPYNIGFDYGHGHDDRLSDADYLTWVESWVRASRDRLTPDGSFWLLVSDEYAAECNLIVKRHFTIRNWLVWYETFGVNCSDKFNRTKRHLFYAVVDPARLVFHREAVSRPSDRQLKYDDPRANPDGKLLDDVWLDIPRLVGTAAERVPGFPTQLPLALLRRVVGCCTDPGDLVADPFSGSGTTGAAALSLGRRFVGVERNPEFAALARMRLQGVTRDE